MPSRQKTPWKSIADLLKSLRLEKDTNMIVSSEAQCPVCGYFDIGHPAIKQIIENKDPTGLLNLKGIIKCHCSRLEYEQRSRKQLQWSQANLPHNGHARVFDNLKPLPHLIPAIEAARLFLARRGPKCLVFTGPVGVGKSHLLEAICRENLIQGHSSRYDITADWLVRLRHSFDANADESLYDLLVWYQRLDLLALDDLGLEKPTDWAIERLTTVVDERIRNGSRLVVASNQTKAELAIAMGNRLSSRLFGTNPELGDVKVIVIQGQDYRAYNRGRT